MNVLIPQRLNEYQVSEIVAFNKFLQHFKIEIHSSK